MMLKRFPVLFGVLLLFTIHVPLESSSPSFEMVNRTQGSTYAGFVLDTFESLNSTDKSNVISMDVSPNGMVGCAEFSGTFTNPSLGASSVESDGGKDILLFGWNAQTGFWHTTLGGTSNDFCWKVRWTGPSEIGVSGYFEDELTVGSQTLSSHGMKDGFLALYDLSSSQWTAAASVGSISNEEFRSFVKLSNGSFSVIGTSNGNISANSSIPGAPNCASASSSTTACTYVLSLTGLLTPTGMTSLHSTGNVVGMDVIEIGTSSQILVTGYFNKLMTHSGGSVESQGGTANDLFVTRFSAQGTQNLLSAFGGPGIDEARSITRTSTGFAVAGVTESTNANQSSVYKPIVGWEAPVGQGGKDNLVLQLSSTGLITDGFTFGTQQSDSVGEIDTDENGHIYMTGYLGSTFQHPSTNSTLGILNERSAYLGIVNLSGGNTSHLVDMYASTGSNNGDGRTNAIGVMNSDDVWFGGRLSPGIQSNSFFGQQATGYDRAGYILRIGSDADQDSHSKRLDNCPENANTNQADYDSDLDGDVCDIDDDNDGINDNIDTQCPFSTPLPFVSTLNNDHDGDGCADDSEDADDDNDGFSDLFEADYDCPKGFTNWTAGNLTLDRDADGCHDAEEDDDDDGDQFIDATEDQCSSQSSTVFDVNTWMDIDLDGCHDDEDPDVDNDGIMNIFDLCDASPFSWQSNVTQDHDQDGCKDDVEDNDDDNDGIIDEADTCTPPLMFSMLGTATFPVWSDHDGDGCHDNEDLDDDNDGLIDLNDECPNGELGWMSDSNIDHDLDGCRDATEDTDDDNDGVLDSMDSCDPEDGFLNSQTNWSSNQFSDYDGDGCLDSSSENSGYGEDQDDDNDNRNDALDACPMSNLLAADNDLDSDGCKDSEDVDIDGDGYLNENDRCPSGDLQLDRDEDKDGCSRLEDIDDDNDGVLDEVDQCDPNDPGPHLELWNENLLRDLEFTLNEDLDGDGCYDGSPEDLDDDGDGIFDDRDQCDPNGPNPYFEINWASNQDSDYDGDGCKDAGQSNGNFGEDLDDDNDGVLDRTDDCDPDSNWVNSEFEWTSNQDTDVDADGCHDLKEDIDQMAAAQKLIDDAREDKEANKREVWLGWGLIVIIVLFFFSMYWIAKLRTKVVNHVVMGDGGTLEIDQREIRGSIVKESNYDQRTTSQQQESKSE